MTNFDFSYYATRSHHHLQTLLYYEIYTCIYFDKNVGYHTTRLIMDVRHEHPAAKLPVNENKIQKPGIF